MKAYFNENNNWHLINGNFKDEERIEDEEINLDDYEIVKIQSDNYESVEEFNEEISNGGWKFYLYTADDGKIIMEDKYGSFHFFDTEEQLHDFIKPEDFETEDEMIEDYIDECLQD